MANKKLELLKIYYNCVAKKDAHYQSSIYYQQMEKLISFPQVILSSVLSTSTFSQASSTTDVQNKALSWFIASSSLTLTILTAINKYFDYALRKESHRKTSINYGNLERYIKLNISDDEIQNKEIYEYVCNEYSKIRDIAPLITTWSTRNGYEQCLEKFIKHENKLNEIISSNNLETI